MLLRILQDLKFRTLFYLEIFLISTYEVVWIGKAIRVNDGRKISLMKLTILLLVMVGVSYLLQDLPWYVSGILLLVIPLWVDHNVVCGRWLACFCAGLWFGTAAACIACGISLLVISMQTIPSAYILGVVSIFLSIVALLYKGWEGEDIIYMGPDNIYSPRN